jgi:diguanylate cyclase (GGDEF)-like protein
VDPLTGTLNRRASDDELGEAVRRSERTGDPVGVALIDINRFKHVNDSLGHQAGDILLRQAVDAWQRHLRITDRLARIGGDEFAVLVPSCSQDVLASVAERLRQALAYVPGCAVGAATWKPGDTAEELMARADRALYADKTNGLPPASRPLHR